MQYKQVNHVINKLFGFDNNDETFQYFGNEYDRNLCWKNDGDLTLLFSDSTDHANRYFSCEELMKSPHKEAIYVDSFGRTLYQIVSFFPAVYRNHVILFNGEHWIVFEYTVNPPKSISKHLKQFLSNLRDNIDDELPICKICKYKQYWLDHVAKEEELTYCKTCSKKPQHTCSCHTETKVEQPCPEQPWTRLELCCIEELVRELFHHGGIVMDEYKYAKNHEHTIALDFTFRKAHHQELECYVKTTDPIIYLDKENNISTAKIRTLMRNNKSVIAFVIICNHHHFLSFKYEYIRDKH